MDLVFLDLMIPEMDGLTFLQFKREDPLIPDVPVILCSHVTQESYVEEALALGARSCIAKPFSLRQLRENLYEALTTLQA